jgi:hypothetical protein
METYIKQKVNIVESNKLIGNYRDFLKYSNIFCETGTCFGRSVQLALDAGYNWVKSVEAKDDFYKECKEKFKNNKNVELYHGMSVEKLPKMLIGVMMPAVFWLDAHVSGEISAGYQDWAEKGEESEFAQDKILRAELEIVLKNNPKHVILIDDQNGWNEYTQGYVDIVLKYNPDAKFEFWDENQKLEEMWENSGEFYYKNKILVCLP